MNILKAAKYTTGHELIGAVQDEHYLKLMEMFNQEVMRVTEQLDAAYEEALKDGLIAEAQAIHEASEAWAWKSQVFDLEAFTPPPPPSAGPRQLEIEPEADDELPPQTPPME